MNSVVQAIVAGVVRHLIGIAATAGIALSDDQATQVVNALVLLGTIGWSAWQKYRAGKVVEKAAATGVVP